LLSLPRTATCTPLSTGTRAIAGKRTTRFRAKQVAEALESFGEIVTVFSRVSISQPILDEGKEIGPLLAAFQDKAGRTGGSRELMSYVSNLTAAWKSRYEAVPRGAPAASSVAESLSPRNIIRLIAEGLSNKEIAR